MHPLHKDSLLFQQHCYLLHWFLKIMKRLGFRLHDRMYCENERLVCFYLFFYIDFNQVLLKSRWAHLSIEVCLFLLCHQEKFHSSPYQSIYLQHLKQFVDQFILNMDTPLHMIHILLLWFNSVVRFPLLLQIFLSFHQ